MKHKWVSIVAMCFNLKLQVVKDMMCVFRFNLKLQLVKHMMCVKSMLANAVVM